MLANGFEDHKHKILYPVMVDRKYNGMRQVTHIDGAFTRKGEKIITAPHIVDILQPVLKKYPNFVADGELYNHEYRFKLNELIKLVRKTKHFTAEDIEQSEKIVKYYVYDGYGFDNISEDSKCSDRREGLQKLLKGIKYIEVVNYEWAKNEEEVYKVYEKYVQDGYEGAIVRINAEYQHRRTNDLLKVKPVDDDEFEILDLLEGSGNWAGAAKIVTLKIKDKIFNGSVKGCYENCAKMLKEKSRWIGKTVTVTYNGFTGKGTPNFAQLDPENCFKGDR
jgi:ATP-dependent DNA ligase